LLGVDLRVERSEFLRVGRLHLVQAVLKFEHLLLQQLDISLLLRSSWLLGAGEAQLKEAHAQDGPDNGMKFQTWFRG
jgi:hypothetical protein